VTFANACPRQKNVHGARQRGMDQGFGESASEQEGGHRPDRRTEADEIGDDELDRPRAGGFRRWGDRRLRLLGKEKAGDAGRFGRGDEHELGAHRIRCGED
jgi:hypothetical protein